MKNVSYHLAERLRKTIQEEEPRLRAVLETVAAVRPGTGEGWSPKQELGHLIDSATNNRVRFVVAALNGRYAGPTYDGCGWVELGGYSDTLWTDLVELWTRLNEALVRAIERIPEKRLSTQCTINEGDPVSLELLIQDYVLHMQHHLHHILDRKQ
ncbi:MAG: DinB family protein [Acidobacteriaceae bacterium]|nr:DinB family protein [Acidobacteriaceae bacterium]